MPEDEVEPCSKIDAEPMEVEHARLERWDPETSIYKSVCPVCRKGALLIPRDRETGALRREDRCILCGQRVIYTDASVGLEKFST
jgi:uncharacterized protein (DUF983 family)